jgi:hypothetical protein
MNVKNRGGETLFIISTRQRSRMGATRCLEGGTRRTVAPGSTPPDLSLTDVCMKPTQYSKTDDDK